MEATSKVIKFIRDNRIEKVDYPVGADIKVAAKSAVILAEMIKGYSPIVNVNIWVRGSSGSILGALVAAELEKISINTRILYVRKDGESNHGHSHLGPDLDAFNVIIDDFVSSGETLVKIIQEMRRAGVHEVDAVAITGTMENSYWMDRANRYRDLRAVNAFIAATDLEPYVQDFEY